MVLIQLLIKEETSKYFKFQHRQWTENGVRIEWFLCEEHIILFIKFTS